MGQMVIISILSGIPIEEGHNMSKEPLRITRFTDIDFFKRGKVRDVYDLKDKLLVISTDRISCFDVVLPTSFRIKEKS